MGRRLAKIHFAYRPAGHEENVPGNNPDYPGKTEEYGWNDH